MTYSFTFTKYTRQEAWNLGGTFEGGLEEVTGQKIPESVRTDGYALTRAGDYDYDIADSTTIAQGLTQGRRADDWQSLTWYSSAEGIRFHHFTPYGFRVDPSEDTQVEGSYAWSDGAAYNVKVTVDSRDRTGAGLGTETIYTAPGPIVLPRQYVHNGTTYTHRQQGHPDEQVVGDLYVDTDYVAVANLPDTANKFWSSISFTGYEYGGTEAFELRWDRIFAPDFFQPDPTYRCSFSTHTYRTIWGAGPQPGGFVEISGDFNSLRNASSVGPYLVEASLADFNETYPPNGVDDYQPQVIKYFTDAHRTRVSWDRVYITSNDALLTNLQPTPYGFRTDTTERTFSNDGTSHFVYNDGVAYDVTITVHTRDRHGDAAATVLVYAAPTIRLRRKRIIGGVTFVTEGINSPDVTHVGDLYIDTHYIADLSLPDTVHRFWSSVRIKGFEYGRLTPFELRWDRVFPVGFFPQAEDPDPTPTPDPVEAGPYRVKPGTRRTRYKRAN